MSFENTYKGKKVLVTGHTGFKGSWLCTWLLNLGAQVVGYSIDIPTQPSLFESLGLDKKLNHNMGDLANLDALKALVKKEKPDFVFHLAAQAIVSTSYAEPLKTLQTNVMGTAHVLEALRSVDWKCTAVLITSDKCYENVEWVWGYKETDHLGGKDMYSASKAAAEIVIHGYYESFFKNQKFVRMATARAGNVIGGGDWAQDRIIADTMRAWYEKSTLQIRSPKATRPWQHVLEPLSGYLQLGEVLSQNEKFHGQSYNFGPRAEQNRTVVDLIEDLAKLWPEKNAKPFFEITENRPFNEAGLLKLNCDKALFDFKWQATLDYQQTVKFVGEWYYLDYQKKESVFDFTQKQISEYIQFARQIGVSWAKTL